MIGQTTIAWAFRSWLFFFFSCKMLPRVLIFFLLLFLFFNLVQMSTPFEKLLAASKQHNDDSCDGWKDKLVGKVIVNDNEETALNADQVKKNPSGVVFTDIVHVRLFVSKICLLLIEYLLPTQWLPWIIDQTVLISR